jgi:hypothetical protein
MSILTTNNTLNDKDQSGYSDLDLSFKPHPVTGDLMITKGNIDVSRALKNLLLTNNYEKPFSPNYGCNVTKLLFEPMSPFTATTLSSEISYTIKNYEPRVTLDSVVVTADFDNDAYSVSIVYYINNLVQPFSVNFLLSRLR